MQESKFDSRKKYFPLFFAVGVLFASFNLLSPSSSSATQNPFSLFEPLNNGNLDIPLWPLPQNIQQYQSDAAIHVDDFVYKSKLDEARARAKLFPFSLQTVEPDSSQFKFSPRRASECGDLSHVNSKFSGPMGPTRYQGNMGVCYAYSTADALTYCVAKYSKTKFNKHISALDIAEQYGLHIWDGKDLSKFKTDVNQGGLAYMSMNYLLQDKGGACLEENFTSDAGSLNRIRGFSDDDYYGYWQMTPDYKNYVLDQQGHRIWATANSQFNHGTSWLIDKIEMRLNEYLRTGKLACANDPKNPDHGCFNTLGILRKNVFGDREFMAMVDSLRSNPNMIFREIDHRLCEVEPYRRQDVSMCKLEAFDPAQSASAQGPTGHVLFKKIDQQLERGDPVIFSVHDQFLQKRPPLPDTDEGGTGHAMLIIGRRWHADQTQPQGGFCQYEVRNSWGHQCKDSYSKFIKDCDKQTGYFWIDEETLNKNLMQISFFVPRTSVGIVP